MTKDKIATSEMNDKDTWYSNLATPNGIHIKVVAYNPETNSSSIVYGRLDRHGGLPIGNDYMQVLDFSRIDNCWTRHSMISAITYLWSEQEYEKIPNAQIQAGDYVIHNDSLCPIISVLPHNQSDNLIRLVYFTYNGSTYSKDYDSYSLRKRSTPTTPGLYKNSKGEYYWLNPEDSNWYHFTHSSVPDSDMPLTPVNNFEKGSLS